MRTDHSFKPDAAAGKKLAATDKREHKEFLECLGDKLDVAKLAGGFSKRWVDGQMAEGMPYLKLGTRRVRFDLGEVREWLREKYSVQRRGAAKRSQIEPAKPESPE